MREPVKNRCNFCSIAVDRTRLRRIDPQVPVAFTTSSSDHALESYRVQANQYLLKPISASDVNAVLEMARV